MTTLNGEMLNGRVVLYADELAEWLAEQALALADIDPMVLVATGRDTGRYVAGLAQGIAAAAEAAGQDLGGPSPSRQPVTATEQETAQ